MHEQGVVEIIPSYVSVVVLLQLGLPTHEIGHAIGFWHEHIRLDRDNYVSINTDNIYMWNRVNFDVLEAVKVDNMGVQYDLGSIMHYGPKVRGVY